MAHITQPTHTPGFVLRVLTGIWDTLVNIGENCARARMLQEVNMFSDEELERMGLTREQLVRRVFTDGYQM